MYSVFVTLGQISMFILFSTVIDSTPGKVGHIDSQLLFAMSGIELVGLGEKIPCLMLM